MSWMKNLFYFENTWSFAIIWLEQKKVDKVFILKQQTNLMKTWWKPWLTDIKYPKKIAFCGTNALVLLTTVIIIDT